VVSQVASPTVRILYDLYHATNSGDDVAREAVRQLQWIGHLHVASCDKRSRPRSGQRPDYPQLTALITKAGYSGYWGHEFIPGPDVFDELRSSIEHLESQATHDSRQALAHG
jgi:hydroxypyruvate isomerase